MSEIREEAKNKCFLGGGQRFVLVQKKTDIFYFDVFNKRHFWLVSLVYSSPQLSAQLSRVMVKQNKGNKAINKHMRVEYSTYSSMTCRMHVHTCTYEWRFGFFFVVYLCDVLLIYKKHTQNSYWNKWLII